MDRIAIRRRSAGAVRALALAVALVGPVGLGAARPLPPPRPADLPGAPAPAPSPTPPAAPAVSPTSAGPAEKAAEPNAVQACLAELAAAKVAAEPAPQPFPDRPECSVEMPVRLTAVPDRAAPGGSVPLPGKPVLACVFAKEVAGWLSGVAIPVLRAARNASPSAVQTGPGAECRTRDRLPGEKLSAHAIGRALDVTGFAFREGGELSVAAPASPADREAFGALRRAACGWFTTVLGPGSDPYHADHLHLDIQQHGSSDRYRICQ